MNRRISDIQLLRGIAVLFVLVEHTQFNLFGEPNRLLTYIYPNFGGWTGVDLFFAISGFVIARDLIPRLARSDGRQFSTMLSFWVRRASRLWPSAWLWLALILVAVVGFNRSGAFGIVRTNLDATLAGVFNYGNFRLMATFGRSEYGASFPYWSLSLEEQFYLLLPFAVIIFRRWLPWVLLVPLFYQLYAHRHYDLFLMATRSDALMLGVLLAIWSQHPSYRWFEPVFLKSRRWLRWIVLLLLVLGLGAMGSYRFAEFRFWVGVVALISALLVFIGSYDQDYLMPDNPLKKVFLWLGSRSYALYLTHIPAYLASREIWFRIEPVNTVFAKNYNGRLALTAIVLVVIFSELNYRFVETPFRIRGKLLADRINLSPGWFQAWLGRFRNRPSIAAADSEKS
ncbi:acyltransferase [Collimonas sp. OK412]|jgi:peptidoglycan/LPS O-acetylase OafA/YrhL|uniref:acyltransferase family protein n=1 Tax=Collimonas sp. (strain OK412) TaxID=1801619 RepID=UPI0008E00731|nr:acyltransferase [Collimonas sp. OK412]SFC67530.1 Peptidoglycan/LPS O-acetylase OafA/YrhL, contains acyltransferase and SGNH-hydrolase domains [Collimonas sp. OK412]